MTDVAAFDAIGGADAVRALVDRFYDLMDLEPAYAGLRALHPSTLDGTRDKLYWFLSGWLGGPDLYVQRVRPSAFARTAPAYAIGIAERDQWMACMQQAMRESGLDATLQERLSAAFLQHRRLDAQQGGS